MAKVFLLLLFATVLLFVAHDIACNSVISTKENKTEPSKTIQTTEKQTGDKQEEFEIEMKQHVDPCLSCIGNCREKFANDKGALLNCAEACDEDPACLASKKAHPGLEGLHYSGVSFKTSSKKSTSQSYEKTERIFEKVKQQEPEKQIENEDNNNLNLPGSADFASETENMQQNFKTKPHNQKISDEEFDDLQCKACKEHCDTVRHHGSIHAFCLKSCHTCKQ